MPEYVLKIPKLSAINAWKNAKIPKLSSINAWKCAKHNKTQNCLWLTTDMTKTSKANHKKVWEKSENSVIYHFVPATLSD